MSLHIEIDREEDGRWIAELPDLPGVVAYGATCGDALNRVTALALRVLANRVEKGEYISHLTEIFTARSPFLLDQDASTTPTIAVPVVPDS